MIICITTGGGLGMTAEQRLIPVSTFSPELASFNAGSVNFALFHASINSRNSISTGKASIWPLRKILLFPIHLNP